MNGNSEAKPVGATPAVPPAPQTIPMDRLPRSVQWVLGRVSQQDWRHVETLVCRLPFTRDIKEVVQFTDTVWGLARNAECRTVDRITGAEMDGFREEIDAAVRKIVAASARLARRAGLTELLQRYRRLTRRWGANVQATEEPDEAAAAEAPISKVA